MGRPTDWHVLDLDRDPTPGDPIQVQGFARRIHDFADDVGTALRSIRGLSGDSAVQAWTGLSGDEYRRHFDDIPGELNKLERSYRLCGDAVAAYGPKLQQAQGDADRALEQGRQTRADLNAAHSQLASANAWVERANVQSLEYQEAGRRQDVPPPDPDQMRAATRNATQAQASQRSAQSAVDSAQARLDAAKQLAEQARGLRDDAANTAKRAIGEASDAGIQNKKWYEKAVDWVVDHWDEIVAVCKVVVAVLGVIVMIIGGPLAWVLLAAALVVLADTILKYMQGKASLWDVCFAALDCIPGFKGLTTAGGLLKMAKGGLKGVGGLSGQLGDLANGLRGLGKGFREAALPMAKRTCATDPVDVVTGQVILPQTDVSLPGVLSLELSRVHISSYRSGRFFGPSWASTLDQRLEIDDEGVVFFADDGMILYYPVPQPDVPIMPIEGPRWPLAWDGTPGGAMRITVPETGRTLHFDPRGPGPSQGARGMELPLRSLTDRNGNCVAFFYDDDGLPTEVRHYGGYRVGVATTDGRITALDMPASNEVLVGFGYDGHGNLTDVVNSSGFPLRFTYDARGRITSWKDRNNSRYGYAYDEDGRCVRTTGPDGFLSATFAHDTDNRTTVYTDSLGHTTTYRYNEALQVVSRTDALDQETISHWDRYDRLLSRTDPLGRTTHLTNDADGNLVGLRRPDGTTYMAEYNEMRLPVDIVQAERSPWWVLGPPRGRSCRLTPRPSPSRSGRRSPDARPTPGAKSPRCGSPKSARPHGPSVSRTWRSRTARRPYVSCSCKRSSRFPEPGTRSPSSLAVARCSISRTPSSTSSTR
jgi:YD repeat-containing protein